MLTLNRPVFCALTGIEPVNLGNLIRRGQLPFEVDQKASGRGYSMHEAFLTMLSMNFARVHRIELTRSAEIAANLPGVLQPVWSEVGRTGKLLANGTDRAVVEIMAGRAERAGLLPVAIAGTDRAIDAHLRKLDGVVIGSVRLSVSRQAAEFIQRAQQHGVEVTTEFWTEQLVYRPRQSITPAEFATLAEQGQR